MHIERVVCLDRNTVLGMYQRMSQRPQHGSLDQRMERIAAPPNSHYENMFRTSIFISREGSINHLWLVCSESFGVGQMIRKPYHHLVRVTV